jgi:cytoskeletal protein CcmA (bactofilin family)
VGGKAQIAGGEGGNIEVGGALSCDGDLSFSRIDVGGTVSIDGDATGEDIKVGGTVKVTKNLTLSENLKVGGTVKIGEAVKAYTIKVGGKIEAEKAEADRAIETNTLITTLGAKAEYIEIGRRGKVMGPIIADEALIKRRAHIEDIYAKSVELRNGCRVRNVYAEDIRMESNCTVDGEVNYTTSLRSERNVSFAFEPKKTEKLPPPPF